LPLLGVVQLMVESCTALPKASSKRTPSESLIAPPALPLKVVLVIADKVAGVPFLIFMVPL